MRDLISKVASVFIFSLVASSCDHGPNAMNKADALTNAIFKKLEDSWSVDSHPLNFDPASKNEEGKVLKSCWYEVESSRCEELSEIASQALQEAIEKNGGRISGVGGSKTSRWVILDYGRKELFLNIIASPSNNGVKIDVFRNSPE